MGWLGSYMLRMGVGSSTIWSTFTPPWLGKARLVISSLIKALNTGRLARKASASLPAMVVALAKLDAVVFNRMVCAFRAVPAMPKTLSRLLMVHHSPLRALRIEPMRFSRNCKVAW